MRIYFAIMMLALAAPAALGCQCSYSSLDDSTVRAAKSIFVFQLISAEIEHGDELSPASQALIAKVKVVETILGAEVSTEKMRFSTLWCCGSRLDVGHFYAALLSESSDRFDGNPGNLMHMGEFYRSDASEAIRFKSVVSGEHTLEEVYGRYADARQRQLPLPPPPCPRKDP